VTIFRRPGEQAGTFCSRARRARPARKRLVLRAATKPKQRGQRPRLQSRPDRRLSCSPRRVAPSMAGSAVELSRRMRSIRPMEASCFRSFEPVNGARSARRLRRPKAIDRLETSEVHVSMRSTAWGVTERGGAAAVGKGRRLRRRK